ncbi:MAG: ankyrin repeat domain-containing protein, partial [Spirochaetales bacterium]|nr:ankyrin repeat domain-containing protein [Spirochaetales bacterium]
RDYVLFTADGLRVEDPFPIRDAVTLNATVFAVGNAHGEGIIIRDGFVTSRTPERRDGEWHWIRYSAAASPGNSGGPLVDEDGAVIGIVTARSENENLNYALPISEMYPLTTNAAYIRFDYTYRLPMFDGTFRDRLEFTVALPRPLGDLRRWARAQGEDALSASLDGLLAKYHDTIFPNDSGDQEAVLRSNPTTSFPSIVAERDDSTWDVRRPSEIHRVAAGNGGTLRHGQLFEDRFWILEDFSPQVTHRFFEEPHTLLDTILSGYSLTRNIASERIRMTTLGEPQYRRWIADRWTRRWLTLIWDIPFADYALVMVALPTPDGAAGIFRAVSYANASAFRQDFVAMADFMHVPYTGTFAAWTDFLSYPERLPSRLRDLAFSYAVDGAAHISLDGFDLRFDATVQAISDDSRLMPSPSFQVQNDAGVWDVSRLYVYESTEDTGRLSLVKRFAPHDNADDGSRERWNDILSRRHPYTGRRFVSDGDTYIFEPLTGRTNDDSAAEPSFLWTVGQRFDGEVADAETTGRFSRLRSGIELRRITSSTTERADGMTMYQAIAMGRRDEVGRLIKSGVRFDTEDDRGRSPLLVAIELNREGIARDIIAAGADINHRDNQRNNALLLALQHEHSRAFVHLLVDLGAEGSVANEHGRTPLMESLRRGRPSIARRLLDNGVPIDERDAAGLTALYYAADNGHNDIARRLIAAGADLAVGEQSGASVLAVAFRGASDEVVNMLLDRGAPINENIGSTGWTTLMWALRFGNEEAAWPVARETEHVDAVSDDGWSALHLAIRYEKPHIAEHLIERGVHVGGVTDHGATPLILAAELAPVEVVRSLIEHDAVLDRRNGDGENALMVATRRGRTDVVEYLLSAGSSLSLETDAGWSVTDLALRYGNDEICHRLLDAGAPVRSRHPGGGHNQMMMALRYRDPAVSRRLSEMGASSDLVTSKDGFTELMHAAFYQPESVEMLLNGRPTNLNAQANDGRTALHMAVARRHPSAVLALIRAGADVTITDGSGATPWDVAGKSSPVIRGILASALGDAYESSVQAISIDFEDTDDLELFDSSIGARLRGGRERFSEYGLSTVESYSGLNSLGLSADGATSRWYWLRIPLETDANRITVTYAVKGDGIVQEGQQYDNCYVGFVYTDGEDKRFQVNQYDGTFEWQFDSETIHIGETNPDEIDFAVFLTKTGNFWIDDIVILYE